MTGLDIHPGLRIRLAYNPDAKRIEALWSAETPNTVEADVMHYIATVSRNLGYAEAWLQAHAALRAGADA